ncbi:hypothetical protein HHK36_001770 [Tetracentron sinense]|uniref:Uncharacterized protein n=1 Tax=Tetracentron sinense TaxID=13715 RepID=A0A835DVA7_TETSI|nr:hypothetical protein HHK36_001770 [Tetracentron sinense]
MRSSNQSSYYNAAIHTNLDFSRGLSRSLHVVEVEVYIKRDPLRNGVIFNGTTPNSISAIATASHNASAQAVRWIPPEMSWLKINTDGATLSNLQVAGAAAIVPN